MKKIIIILLLMTTLFMVYGNKKLTVCNGVVPDGHPVFKIYSAILKEAYKRIGYEMEAITLPGLRSLKDVNKGVYDGEMVRIKAIVEDYPNLVIVDEPLLYTYQVAYSTRTDIKINGWESIYDYDIILLSGTKAVTTLKDKMKKGSIVVVESLEQGLKMLINKRGDLIIAAPEQIKAILQMNEYKDKVKQLEPPIEKIAAYTFLHKKHAALAKKLEAAIREMKKDGTFDTLLKGGK